MSKGSKVLLVRIPGELLDSIKLQIKQRNIYTLEKPWNVSDFLRAAVREKLAKMERSRRGRGKKAPPAAE